MLISKRSISLLICLTLCWLLAVGQTPTTARLNGTVVDPMGAATPKVKITISNSNASFNAVSDEDGKFKIDLPVGSYQIRSDKLPGFAATNRNVAIETGKTAEISIVPAISFEDAICILRVTGSVTTRRHRRRRHR
jgi:hypothetical protein